MRVLVVSAHPDDEILGPGGTIIRHAEAGDDLTILLACCGTNLRYAGQQADDLHDIARKVRVAIGAKEVLFGDLPDQGLDTLAHTEVVSRIEEAISRHDPQIVYTHFWGDINRDHRILSEAVMVATRPYAAPGVHAVRCFETPSSTEWGPPAGLPPFNPTRFVDITGALRRKLDAFEQYRSEVRDYPHPRSRQALEARARYWGSVAGMEAAEAFVVARETW